MVSFPIKNGDFPQLRLFTRGYVLVFFNVFSEPGNEVEVQAQTTAGVGQVGNDMGEAAMSGAKRNGLYMVQVHPTRRY